MVRPNTSCLLAVLVALATTLPTPGYREEANLLTSIGLGHIASKFEAAEVEIEHMADLDNTELTSLGNHSFPLLSSHIFSSSLLSSPHPSSRLPPLTPLAPGVTTIGARRRLRAAAQQVLRGPEQPPARLHYFLE